MCVGELVCVECKCKCMSVLVSLCVGSVCMCVLVVSSCMLCVGERMRPRESSMCASRLVRGAWCELSAKTLSVSVGVLVPGWGEAVSAVGECVQVGV